MASFKVEQLSDLHQKLTLVLTPQDYSEEYNKNLKKYLKQSHCQDLEKD